MSFDRQYYQRFYHDPRTAVTSRAEMQGRARMIAAAVDYVGVPVRSILDAGCGIGLMRRPLLRALPRATYTGIDASEYLCKRYGWRHGSIASLRLRERFELVVCYDVLQYLTTEQARAAIVNLGRWCRGALYFGALTREDWEHNCDQSRTDPDVKLRSTAWYRRELARAFLPLGFGIWLNRKLDIPMWELDKARA
ncbi:MAG: class I SAM-dependent methyltransferase [Nitrospira sp.]